jgi:molybdopterin/thiamine biosynthesis adenylyltransferase
MKKMAASNVLIVGMKGLGVEIGKLADTPLRYPSTS